MTLLGITDQETLNDAIFEVDFPVAGHIPKVVAEMSFTFVHWKLAETLASSSNKIKLKNLNMKLIKMLALNIFPQGNTVLHSCFKNLNIIRKIFTLV